MTIIEATQLSAAESPASCPTPTVFGKPDILMAKRIMVGLAL